MIKEEKVNRKFTKNFKRILILLLVPTLLSLVLPLHTWISFGNDDRAAFRYGAGWIFVSVMVGIYWISGAVAIPCAGFLTFIVLPLLGTVHSKTLAMEFLSNSNASTFGAIAIMIAYDSCGLRRRLTLWILQQTGGASRYLFIHIYLVTIILAIWLGSAGAAYLMMQTIEDVLESLKEEVGSGALGEERAGELQRIRNMNEFDLHNEQESYTVQIDDPSLSLIQSNTSPEEVKKELVPSQIPLPPHRRNKEEELELFEMDNDEMLQNFGGRLLYAVAVAANLGGALWSHGSTMGMEMFKRDYTHKQLNSMNTTRVVYRWTEASWMLQSFPLVLINSVIALVFLLWVNFSRTSVARCIAGVKGKCLCYSSTKDNLSLTQMSKIFARKREDLGPWQFHEIVLLFLTVILVLLCLTRQPLFVPGWSEAFPYRSKTETDPKTHKAKTTHIETGDSVPYILIVFVICFIPKVGHKIFSGPKTPTDKIRRDGVLGWKTVQNKFPWAIPVLIGASRALGKFAKTTVAGQFAYVIRGIPPSSIGILKLTLIGEIIVGSILISNTGAVIAVLHVWEKWSAFHEQGMGKHIFGGGAVLPAFWVSSLCFALPHTSVPTAMVYMNKQKKRLSVGYFLRVGILLTLFTLPVTTAYAILWTHDSVKLFTT